MPMRPSLQMCPGMMPAFALPGEIRPGQFGPIRRVVGRALQERHRAHHVERRDAFGDADDERRCPASAASMTASAANGGGTKITDAFAPVFSTASCDGVEDRASPRASCRPCRA